jgi:CHAT domain-containing protein
VFAPFPDSLPGTEREGRAVARLSKGGQLRLGGASTEAAVRAALGEGRPVHVASHGAHNAQNPLFSRVIVGARPAGGVDAADDGRLEVHEILGLRTASPLVFLSGCETGLSVGDAPFASGVDDGSLAQAFLVAGAASVVATLWRVDDADAVRMATSFYRALGAGASPEEALARAQRESIRNRSGGFTWAAYEASGASRANPAAVSVKLGTNP